MDVLTGADCLGGVSYFRSIADHVGTTRMLPQRELVPRGNGIDELQGYPCEGDIFSLDKVADRDSHTVVPLAMPGTRHLRICFNWLSYAVHVRQVSSAGVES